MPRYWYLWAGVFVLLAIGSVSFWWDLAAGVTVKETRFSKQSIKIMRAEGLSTNGTTPIRGTSDYSVDQLRAKLMRGLTGDYEDDELLANHDKTEGKTAPTQTGKGIEDGNLVVGALEDGSRRVQDELDVVSTEMERVEKQLREEASTDGEPVNEDTATKPKSFRESLQPFRDHWQLFRMQFATSYSTDAIL